MMPRTAGLFDGIPEKIGDELVQTLARSGTLRIERIVSDGHATPPGEWYDQESDEWVLLASGGATLLFADGSEPLHMKPGDHVLIPAHCRHRVERTDPVVKTVWLAVHFDNDRAE